MNDPHTSNADAERARRRDRRVAIFFVLWTVLVAAGAWWLWQPHLPPEPLHFGGAPEAQHSVIERVRVWLKLADLNFRGAYPWILLAPYVVWFASRLPLERGRLRSRLPAHLAAYALFAFACHLIAARQETGGQKIVVIASYDTATNSELPLVTNRSEFVVNGVITTNPFQLAPVDRENFAFVTNRLPPPPDFGPSGRDFLAQQFSMETNASGGVRQIASASWTAAFWAVPRPFALLLDFLAYGALLGGAHAVHFYRRFREREQRAVLLESSLSQARLSALQAQLHPHFLFNALNAVATLIRSNPAAALETLTSFSDLLRLALSQSDKHEIPLREDLKFLESYLEIQQVRLGDRLRIERDVDPAALDCTVPALLMQPLVENALRHGIEPSPNPGVLRFTAKIVGKKLEVTIADNGVGLDASRAANPKPGIGLSNLRTRLKTLYGNDQLLEVGANPGGGVLVRVEIPVRTEALHKQTS